MINSGREWDWMHDLIKIEKEMGEDKRKEMKVKHPEYGHVIFYDITPRQRDVLENFTDGLILTDDILAKNKMLADKVREQNTEIKKLKSKITELKSKGGNTPYIDYLG
jgi:hypothetical protein